MKFGRAFKLMQSGEKIKLPSWGGYWYWDDEKENSDHAYQRRKRDGY